MADVAHDVRGFAAWLVAVESCADRESGILNVMPMGTCYRKYYEQGLSAAEACKMIIDVVSLGNGSQDVNQ